MSQWCYECQREKFTGKYEPCGPNCPVFRKYPVDLDCVVLGLEQAINQIKVLKEEALRNADHAAAGYDEGWYVGEDDAYEKVLELLEPVLWDGNKE